MATQKKTADVDYSMQEKIIALYELQKIDSRIDEINKVKGELPLEVQDLEDEMTGLKTRIDNINAEIEELNTLTKQRKREVDQAKILIGNYKEQQNNVRNNREFDAITKEIEYQELEIELAEKRLKEYAAGVKAKKLQLEEAEAVAEGRAADLAAKKNELEGIEAETAPQVAEYEVQADRVKAKIDERLLSAYGRIRSNVRNGLAVVTVKRDACGGCFNRIPRSARWRFARARNLSSANIADVSLWPIPKRGWNSPVEKLRKQAGVYTPACFAWGQVQVLFGRSCPCAPWIIRLCRMRGAADFRDCCLVVPGARSPGCLPDDLVGEDFAVGGVARVEGGGFVLDADHRHRAVARVAQRTPAGRRNPYDAPLAYGEDLPVDLELPVSAEDDVKFFVGLVGVEEPDAAARCELLERHLGPGGLQIAAYEYFSRISTPGASGSAYWFNSSVFPTVTAAKFAPEATFSTFSWLRVIKAFMNCVLCIAVAKVKENAAFVQDGTLAYVANI